MTEKGRVREIKGNLVTVIPDIDASCSGCMNVECKAGGRSFQAENLLALPVSLGQTVEISAPGVSLTGQVLMAFMPLALGFAAGFFLARLFFPEAGEGVHACSGVVCLFASAFIVYRVRRKKQAEEVFSITRIIANNK